MKFLNLSCLLLLLPLNADETIKQKININVMSFSEWMQSSVPNVDYLRYNDHTGYGIKIESMKELLAESGASNLAQSLDYAKKSTVKVDAKRLYVHGLHFRYAIGIERNHQKMRACFALSAKHGYAKAQHAIAWLCIYEGDIHKGLEWMEKAANQGQRKAQFDLGCLHLNPTDPDNFDAEKALLLIETAAKQGLVEAQRMLASMYLDGKELKKDAAKAREWFALAAKQDDAFSLSTLAIMQHCGIGGPVEEDALIKEKIKNNKIANDHYYTLYRDVSYLAQRIVRDPKKWHKILLPKAEAGDAAYQYKLAFCYSNGFGVEYNRDKAFSYIQRAAKSKYLKAQLWLADFYQSKSYYLNFMKNGEVWGVRAAKSGDAQAQALLGHFYMGDEDEPGDHKDYKKAVYWLGQAAEQNNCQALLDLAYLTKRGWAVAKDDEQSQELYARAAKLDSPQALFILAQQCLVVDKGQPSKEAISKAYAYYARAADLGDMKSQVELGRSLIAGYHAPKNQEQGVYWLEIAAELGSRDASEYLANAYYYAKGVPKDLQKAFYLYLKASTQKSASAAYSLGAIFIKGEASVKKDLVKAEYFFKQAFKEEGLGRAELVQIYIDGKNTKLQDLPQSYKMLKDILSKLDFGQYASYLKLTHILKAAPELKIDKQYLASMEEKANQGDSHAQVNMGIINEYGMNGKQDSKLALQWYEKANAYLFAALMEATPDAQRQTYYQEALKLSSADAAYGLSYRSEKRVPLLNQAAEGGVIPAQVILYKEDKEKSAYWCEKLAEAGFAFYQNKMGDITLELKDEDKAVDWYQSAAQQGNIQAMMSLGKYYEQSEYWDESFEYYKNAYKKSKSDESLKSYERVLNKIYEALSNSIDGWWRDEGIHPSPSEMQATMLMAWCCCALGPPRDGWP